MSTAFIPLDLTPFYALTFRQIDIDIDTGV